MEAALATARGTDSSKTELTRKRGGGKLSALSRIRHRSSRHCMPCDTICAESEEIMRVATYEAVIENGQVRLPIEIHLPEKAKVYVVVPDVPDLDARHVARIASPRLAHPGQAAYFEKEVVEEDFDAEIR
ncbi:MAG: hypothetical protein ABI977_30480 [Acidobacteriota bacterium]